MTLNVVSITGSIGMVYQSWGRPDRALEYYSQALELAEQIGAMDQVLTNLRLIASIYQGRREFETAVDYYRQSLDLARELGRAGDVGVNYDGLGSVYFEWRKFDKALDYYEQALEQSRAIGKRDQISRNLIHIAGVYQIRGDTSGALETYEEALAMTRKIGARADEATVLNNIGTLFLNNQEYRTAADYFGRAIAVKEQLRDTAEGEIRRDFLASWISSYRWLIAAYLFDDQPVDVFRAGELIKARYLSEQIGERSGTRGGSEQPVFPGIAAIQRTLSATEAVISYGNIDWDYPLIAYADRRNLDLHDIGYEPFVSRNYREHRTAILKADNRTRGFTTVEIEESEIPVEDQPSRFAEIIRTYRWLLSRPRLNTDERKTRDDLGRALYALLLQPLEEHLEGKQELIVVPDGILAFLPFEALIMPDGRYLVERFHIRYLPSLTVSTQIQRRNYGSRPKALLAFGGAVYKIPAGQGARQSRPDTSPIVSAQALKSFSAETRRVIRGGLDTRDAYATLGLNTWQDLPGTLTEVREIGRIVEGSDVITGPEVSEDRIKEMSVRGVLEDYRVLHFATHGLVVPPLPELSALVLSQDTSQGGAAQAYREDGYLTMGEIGELEIRADFVNLSACETGLGKIYGGEGVVGLSQAFLVAGANGLSVSLWQVADESTRTFMVGLYRLTQEEGLTYQQAMSEMKRRFIADPSLNDPFYWAPFVYYGR
jgi:CHAT domain-containing protein/Tfp pilus assembly protein PilF